MLQHTAAIHIFMRFCISHNQINFIIFYFSYHIHQIIQHSALILLSTKLLQEHVITLDIGQKAIAESPKRNVTALRQMLHTDVKLLCMLIWPTAILLLLQLGFTSLSINI